MWSAFLPLVVLLAGCGKKAEPVAEKAPETAPLHSIFPPQSPPPLVKPEPEPTIDPSISPVPTPFVSSVEIAPAPHADGEKADVVVAEPPVVVVAQAPKPAEPPTPTTPATPVTPKKVEYPKAIDGKDLQWWLNEARKNSDPQVRQNALNVIPAFGPDARKPSIKPLVEIVMSTEKDPGVRMAAITLLSVMGYEQRADEKLAIAAILSSLTNAPPGTLLRAYCVKSIGSFGPDAASTLGAIENLRKCLFDPSWETRLAATTALGSVGIAPYDDPRDKKVTPVPDSKKTPEPKKGPNDPHQFDPKGPNPEALRALINQSLNDDCASVRLEATQCLIRCGPPVAKDPKEYAKVIEDFLKPINRRANEKDDMGRKNTLMEKSDNVLVWLLVVQIMYNGETMKENLVRIAGHIKNPDKIVRVNALNALAVLGSKSSVVVQEVIDALSYEEPALLAAAMTTLASMGKDGGSAVPELEKIKNGSKDQKKPDDAPKDWKPDDSLRKIAADVIDYVTGKKKAGEEPKKEEPKKE